VLSPTVRPFSARTVRLRFRSTSHLFALSLPPPASARRGFLQARSRTIGSPCDSPNVRDAGCVRTDFCHSTHRLRAPASRGFSTGVATLARARSDEQSGVSRCPIRFGVPSEVFLVVGLLGPCRLLDGVTTTPRTEPLTLLSLLVVPTCALFRMRLPTVSRLPRPSLSRVREDHAASTTRRAFHRRRGCALDASALPTTDLPTLPPGFGRRRSFAHRAFTVACAACPVTRELSRLARSPATQASRPFWESEHLRFSRPSGARRLLQHTYQHVGAPNGRFALARIGGMPRYALQDRELAQTICSEPRALFQSLLETGKDRVGRATREKDPRDAGAPPRM